MFSYPKTIFYQNLNTLNTIFTARFYTHTLGMKEYEITNHASTSLSASLGNVLATVLDRKTGVKASPTATTYAYFKADVTTAQDYYPFGSLMPGRTYVAPANAAYRFGFNGMQRDDELKGLGNALDFGARMYDSRLGRWMSVDPLAKEYVSYSPFVFALSTPIQAKDPDGNLVIFINGQHKGVGGTAKYWEGYDNRVMDQLNDHSARYVDGALGGFTNTIGIARLGAEMSLMYGSSPAGALFNAVLTTINASNLSLQVRKEAGKAQGLADAAAIYASLGEGETVKIVTHSMGTAFSRGYVDGLNQWASKNGKKITIEFQLDVNAFQGSDLAPSTGVPTYNKTGGQDGFTLSGLINHGLTGTVPTVSPVPVPKGHDLTSSSDKSKGHAVKGMSILGIPELGNNGNRSAKPIEQGSNNENVQR